MTLWHKKAQELSVQGSSPAEQTNDLVFFLMVRFVAVLLVVMAAEWIVVWLEGLLAPTVARAVLRNASDAPVQTMGSLLALLRWMALMVSALAQARYAQVVGLAGRSLAVITLIVMLLLLVAPPLLGALAYARMVVRKMRALEERRAQELAQVDRQRNQFMTDIAHDLRTPLMAIRGMAQALLEGLVRDDATRAQYLQAICDKSEKMSELVGSVFDYTKLGGGSFALERTHFDLPQMLLREAAVAYTDVEEAGMHLSVEVPEDRCTVFADELQLARVVANLLANAVRHNQAGVEVALLLVRRAGVAYVVVADAGDPIEGDTDDLFQPFSRGDAARSATGGSGLGLSICRRIAELHGYDLSLVQPYGRFAKAFVLRCTVVD